MKALELREAGRSLEQIFAVFPDAAEELKQYFQIAADLRAEAHGIAPPSRELLRSALRRAEALRNASAISAKPAFANFFDRMPFGLRVAAPALAVLLILFLANRPAVTGPGIGPAVNEQAVAPEAETTADSSIANDESGPNVDNAARPPAPQAFMSKAPASNPTPAPVPPAAPTAAMSAAGTSAAAPQSLAEATDQVAQAYLANAESEKNIFTDTFAEEQAVRSDDPSALSSRWAQQDNEKAIGREEVGRISALSFSYLEQSLAGASEDKRNSLLSFRAALGSASTQRQLAIDIANSDFRTAVLDLFQDGPANLDKFLQLAAQHQADVRAITSDFKAQIGAAQAAFKAVLDI